VLHGFPSSSFDDRHVLDDLRATRQVLLARQREGAWPVEVTRRALTNGSIYIEMAHLSAGVEAPDRFAAAVGRALRS